MSTPVEGNSLPDVAAAAHSSGSARRLCDTWSSSAGSDTSKWASLCASAFSTLMRSWRPGDRPQRVRPTQRLGAPHPPLNGGPTLGEDAQPDERERPHRLVPDQTVVGGGCSDFAR